ncbi:hypothetical protein [Massilia sp. TS11]|uniref:hypothetical protein n=1 Tax=Massilia sp. TS11 TaxID=2908003 RepID=UPI001EDB694D|nr:hypothetical protein [Massilia sp. TS11]MCG2584060.1 hypothetical protein [Massilia sp. TS11]
MNRASKAALLSGLVFPGVGQFYLRDWMRGIAFSLPSLVSLVALADNVLSRAEQISNLILAGKLAPELGAIAAYLDSQPPPPAVLSFAGPVLLLCWVGSIIDALYTGRPSP